jgi:hypothetical protein
MTDPKPLSPTAQAVLDATIEPQFFNGCHYITLENPFPGGSVFERIEIYQFDAGEWFWRDYMDHYMGPCGSLKQATNDAISTYRQGWNK